MMIYLVLSLFLFLCFSLYLALCNVISPKSEWKITSMNFVCAVIIILSNVAFSVEEDLKRNYDITLQSRQC